MVGTWEGENLNGLKAALLLELDNIVTAAMVTQLSNFLDLFIYGRCCQPEILVETRASE